MLIKQKNEDGEEVEVEVFTADEHATKVKEEKEAVVKEFEQKIQEKDTSLSALAKEKADLEAQMVDTSKDNPNFKVLKEALDKKDKDIADLRNEINADKTKTQKEGMEAKIKSASKGNADLEKKIKLNLESVLVGMKEGTEEERQAKITAALKLSIDNDSSGPGIFDGGAGGGGRGSGGMNFEGSSPVEFTAREKALGAKLGITAEDYKKFGSRLNKKK